MSKEEKNRLKISNSLALVVITVIMLATLGSIITDSQQSDETCGDINIYLNVDGSVEVYEYLHVSEDLPASLNVTLLAEPIYIEVKGLDSKAIIPFETDNDTLSITILNDTQILVYYVTTNLTIKESQYWTLKYQSPCETKLILADEIVPLTMTPSNPEPIVVNGTVALKFPPGTVTVNYVVVPSIGESTQSPSTTNQSQSPNTPNTTESANYEKLFLVLIIIIALLVIYYLFTRSSKGVFSSKKPSNGGSGRIEVKDEILDERDKAILKALADGEKTAAELIEITGIPKTPLYRRLRKLIDRGLIEYFDSGGSRKYRLRK